MSNHYGKSTFVYQSEMILLTVFVFAIRLLGGGDNPQTIGIEDFLQKINSLAINRAVCISLFYRFYFNG